MWTVNSRNRFGAWRNAATAAAECACARAREPLQWCLQHPRRALRRDYECCHLAFSQWSSPPRLEKTQTIYNTGDCHIHHRRFGTSLDEAECFIYNFWIFWNRQSSPCQHAVFITNKDCRRFVLNLLPIAIFRAFRKNSFNNGTTFPKLIAQATWVPVPTSAVVIKVPTWFIICKTDH